MKHLLRPILLSAVLSAANAATISVTDDFNGPSLNNSNWNTILPYGSSNVVQSGGAVTTTGRGILATVAQFGPTLTISGAFTMQHDLEGFVVAFRTDLSPLPEADLFHTLSGMFLAFANDVDQISIQGRGFSPQGSTPQSHINYTLTTGQTYFFTITDTGTDISVSINGVPQLFASTPVSTGGHVAFYSREFAITSTQLDAVSIVGQTVPDGGRTIGLLALALVGMGAMRMRRTSTANFA